MNVTVTHNGNDFPAVEDAKLAKVTELQPVIEDHHLASEHGLRKISAYIQDGPKRKKTDGAKRVEKFRDKKKESGEIQVWMPAADDQRLKAAGGLDALISAERKKAVTEEPLTNNKTKPSDDKEDAIEGPLASDEVIFLWTYRCLKGALQAGLWLGIAGGVGLAIYAAVKLTSA